MPQVFRGSYKDGQLAISGIWLPLPEETQGGLANLSAGLFCKFGALGEGRPPSSLTFILSKAPWSLSPPNNAMSFPACLLLPTKWSPDPKQLSSQVTIFELGAMCELGALTGVCGGITGDSG